MSYMGSVKVQADSAAGLKEKGSRRESQRPRKATGQQKDMERREENSYWSSFVSFPRQWYGTVPTKKGTAEFSRQRSPHRIPESVTRAPYNHGKSHRPHSPCAQNSSHHQTSDAYKIRMRKSLPRDERSSRARHCVQYFMFSPQRSSPECWEVSLFLMLVFQMPSKSLMRLFRDSPDATNQVSGRGRSVTKVHPSSDNDVLVLKLCTRL